MYEVLLRNKFDSVLIGDIPCLKNLIIFRIISDSSLLLDANLKVKLKGLSVGAENNNSKFGFIINPAVLAKILAVVVALSTNNPVIAACTSGIILIHCFYQITYRICPPLLLH
jgi:hypothetical protein